MRTITVEIQGVQVERVQSLMLLLLPLLVLLVLLVLLTAHNQYHKPACCRVQHDSARSSGSKHDSSSGITALLQVPVSCMLLFRRHAGRA